MITNPIQQRTLRGVLPSHPTARPGGRVRDSAEHQAALAWRLTPRDHWIVAMLAEHRVLTATQITGMAFPSFRAGRQRLRELHQWSVVDRFQPFATVGSAPMHYVLAPAGAAVLAATHGLEPRELGYRHDRTLGIAHSLQLAHTIGVAEWFASLVSAARHSTGTAPTALETWWSETRCGRLFGDLVRPDGYGRWTTRGRRIEFFLEFDLGTEALSRVAAKLAGYAALAAATSITTPLLVWLPTPRREAGARTALHRAWRHLDRPSRRPRRHRRRRAARPPRTEPQPRRPRLASPAHHRHRPGRRPPAPAPPPRRLAPPRRPPPQRPRSPRRSPRAGRPHRHDRQRHRTPPAPRPVPHATRPLTTRHNHPGDMNARIGAALLAVVVLLPILVLAAVQSAVTSVFGASSPSPNALADIPADYLALYRQAAPTCPGLDWSVLAAVGKVETDHGRSPLPGVRDGENAAGAAGPMQFLAPTFAEVVARHPLPPGGALPPSRYDPHDAVHAAAHYLCDSGASTGDLNAEGRDFRADAADRRGVRRHVGPVSRMTSTGRPDGGRPRRETIRHGGHRRGQQHAGAHGAGETLLGTKRGHQGRAGEAAAWTEICVPSCHA